MKYVRVSASAFDSIWNLVPMTTGSAWLSAPHTPSDETEAHTASMAGSNNRGKAGVFTVDPYVRQESRGYWSRCKNLPQRSYYCSDPESSGGPSHPRPRRIDLLRIQQLHPRRLPLFSDGSGCS